MRKIFSLLSIAVAVMIAFSCSKETLVTESSKGTPIKITVSNPEIVDPEAAAAESKVAWRNESTRQPEWEDSDAFQMIAYSVSKQISTSWGDFIVTGMPSQYNTKIEFTGYKPKDFSTDPNDEHFGGNYFVGLVKNPSNPSYTLDYAPSGTSGAHYEFYANIPPVQDGTGFKYSVIAGQYTFNGTTFTNTNGNSVFLTRSALCKLTLPSGSNIKQIDITLSYSLSDANQYWASDGTSQDLRFQLMDAWSGSFTFLNGGGSKTITIKNGDNILPESPNNIYWACIRTAGNATRGYPILTFRFTNNEDKVATKVIKMQVSGTIKNIANGKTLNNFGAVTFNTGDFKDPS